MLVEFSPELAITLVRSAETYPVDFDDAWQWLGYSRKEKAKLKLMKNFEQGLDFGIFHQTVQNSAGQGIGVGRPAEKIRLTVDCFKSLGMMAGTEKGREIRRYFLECERQLKAVPAAPQLSDAGAGISELAQRWGFGRGTKANGLCRAWIRAQGIGDDQWVQCQGGHPTRVLPRSIVAELDSLAPIQRHEQVSKFLGQLGAVPRDLLKGLASAVSWCPHTQQIVILTTVWEWQKLIEDHLPITEGVRVVALDALN
jgi:phage anti-repressor protein